MNAAQWFDTLVDCDDARKHIPMELQATLPLPGGAGENTVACWYYRLESHPDGLRISSPARYALWDVKELKLLQLERLESEPLGSGADVLTREHRECEDAYLDTVLSAYLEKGTPGGSEALESWLAAAPEALRPWLRDAAQRKAPAEKADAIQ